MTQTEKAILRIYIGLAIENTMNNKIPKKEVIKNANLTLNNFGVTEKK